VSRELSYNIRWLANCIHALCCLTYQMTLREWLIETANTNTGVTLLQMNEMRANHSKSLGRFSYTAITPATHSNLTSHTCWPRFPHLPSRPINPSTSFLVSGHNFVPRFRALLVYFDLKFHLPKSRTSLQAYINFKIRLSSLGNRLQAYTTLNSTLHSQELVYVEAYFDFEFYFS
jgi:hypothetical protein